MKFLYPVALALILLLPWIIYLWNKERKFQVFRRLQNQKEIFGELRYGKGNSIEGKNLELIRIMVYCILFIFGVLIIAHPVKIIEKEDPLASGVDIIMVLDLSKSMLAEDIQPNRIESAKQAMEQFVQSASHNRVGLVGFAGKPFVFSPLTFDTAGLTQIIRKITVDSIRQEITGLSGTAIGDGLLLTTSTLETGDTGDVEGRKKIILLLTDGEANVGTDPRSTLPLLKELGTTVYSIGIGNPNGTELYTTNSFGEKEYFTDANGVPIKATLDEELMKLLSDQTGGKYVNIQSKKELIEALNDIGKKFAKPLEVPKILEYERNFGLLIWGIIFFLILFLVLEQFDARSSFRLISYFYRLPSSIRNYSSKIQTNSMNFIIHPQLLKAKVIVLICILLLSVVILNMSIPKSSPEKTILLIDISKSMNVRDIKNGTEKISRIDAAKSLASLIVQDNEKIPTSIILFGNSTRLEIPFTTDTNELLRTIETIKTGGLPGKTNVFGAVQEALLYLGKDVSGQLILFTDGEDTLSEANNKIYTSPRQTIQTFAIGTANGGEIPLGTDAFGNEYIKSEGGTPIISRLDIESLKSILPNIPIYSIDSIFDYSKSKVITVNYLARGVDINPFDWKILISIIYGLLIIVFISLPYRTRQNNLQKKDTKIIQEI